jgi:hypothetical protein
MNTDRTEKASAALSEGFFSRRPGVKITTQKECQRFIEQSYQPRAPASEPVTRRSRSGLVTVFALDPKLQSDRNENANLD